MPVAVPTNLGVMLAWAVITLCVLLALLHLLSPLLAGLIGATAVSRLC
jgi:hypothetical protein